MKKKLREYVDKLKKDEQYFVNDTNKKTFFVQKIKQQKEFIDSVPEEQKKYARELIAAEDELKKLIINSLTTIVENALTQGAKKDMFELKHVRNMILDSILNYTVTLFPLKDIMSRLNSTEIHEADISQMLEYNIENMQRMYKDLKLFFKHNKD